MSEKGGMEGEKTSMEEVQNLNNNNIDKAKEEDDTQDENDGTKGYGLNVRRIKNMFSVDTDPPEPKRPVLAPRPWSAFMSRSSVVMESMSPNGRHRSTGGEAVSPCYSENKFFGTKKVFESGAAAPAAAAAVPLPVSKERATPSPLSPSASDGKDAPDRSPASGGWRLSPSYQSASPKTEFAMPVAQVRKSSEVESQADDPSRERRKSDKPVPIFGHQVNAGPMSKRLEKFLQDDDDDDDDNDNEAGDVFDAKEKGKAIKTEIEQSRDTGPMESKISPALQSQSSSFPPIAQKPQILPRVTATATSVSRPVKVLTSPSAALTSPVAGSVSPVVDKPSPTAVKLSPTGITTSPEVVKTSQTAVLASVSLVNKSPKPISTSSASVTEPQAEDEPRVGHSPVSPTSRESFRRARQFNLECPRPFRSQHDSQGVRWSRIEVPLSPTAMDTGSEFPSEFPAAEPTAAVLSAQKTSDTKVTSPQSKVFETDPTFPKRKISESKTVAWSEMKIAKTEVDLPECDLPEADASLAQTKVLETKVTLSQKKIPDKEVALPESKVVSEIDVPHFTSKASEAQASIIEKCPKVDAYAVTEVDTKVENVSKTSPGVSHTVFEQKHAVSTEAKAMASPKQQAVEDNHLKSGRVLNTVQARSAYFEITTDNRVKEDDKQEPCKTSILLSHEVATAARSVLDKKMHAQKEVLEEDERDFTSTFDALDQLSNVSDAHATVVIESEMHAEREVLDDSDGGVEEEDDYVMAVEEQVEIGQVATPARVVDLKKPGEVYFQTEDRVFVDGDTKSGPGVEGHRAAQELGGNLEPQLAAAHSHSTKTSITLQKEMPPAAEKEHRDVRPPVVEQTREPVEIPADLDAFPVELEKGPKGLGIGILGRGPNPEKQNIHVAALLDGGAAKVDGRIGIGDQVLEVDGVSLVGISEEAASTLLKDTTGRVKLLIGRQKSATTKPQSPSAKEALHTEPKNKKETEQKAVTKVTEQKDVPEHLAAPKVSSPGIRPVESDQTEADVPKLCKLQSAQEVPSAELGWHQFDKSEISVQQVPRALQSDVGDHRALVGKPGTVEKEAPEEDVANEQIASNVADETHAAWQPILAVCPADTVHHKPPRTTTVAEEIQTSQIPLSFSESILETSVLNAAREEAARRPISCEDPCLLGDLKHPAWQEPQQEVAEHEVPGRDGTSHLEHRKKTLQTSSLPSAGDEEKEEDEEDSATELDEVTVTLGEEAAVADRRAEQRGRVVAAHGEEDDDSDGSGADADVGASELHFTKVSAAEPPSLAPHGEAREAGEGDLRWGIRDSLRSLGSEEDESGEERALMELAEDRGVMQERLTEALASHSPPHGSRDHREKAPLTEHVGSTGSPDQHADQSAPLLRDIVLGTVEHDLPPRTLEVDPLSSVDAASVTDARDVLSRTLQHKGLAGDQAPDPSPCDTDEEPESVVAEPPTSDEDDERKVICEASDGEKDPVAAGHDDEEEEELSDKAGDKEEGEEDAEVRVEDERPRETVDAQETEKPRRPTEEGDDQEEEEEEAEEPAEPSTEPSAELGGDEKAKEDGVEEGDAENEDEGGGSGDVDIPGTPDTATEEPREGLDFSTMVPLTERLDTSAHKARAQLIVKAKRQKPSRGKLRKTDSEVAEEELESTPTSPATPTVVPGAAETPSPSQATEAPIDAAKSTSLASPVSPASDARTGDEDKEAGFSSPGEGTEDTPTSKSRLKFLDIGASLRRSGRGRKSDKDQRASTLPRDGGETDGSVPAGPDTASSSCMPFLFARKGSFSSTSSAEPGSVNASPEKRRARATLSWPSVFSRTSLETGSEEALQSPAKQQQQQPWPTRNVPEWTPEQVSQWLAQLGMEQHAEVFTSQGVDGKQLLQLDSTKLKALGITNLAERSSIKKKLKEMKTAIEKERKAQEKLERQREKLRKKEEEQLRKSQRASKVSEETPAPAPQ